MDSALYVIGILGNIAAGIVFLSPIPTFWGIVRRGTTGEYQPETYIFTLLNALLWTYYGLTKPEGVLVATINGFGVAMEAVYVVLFIVYAAGPDIRLNTIKWAAELDIGFFGVVLVVTRFAISELNLRIMVIGILCACFNVFMYAAPFSAVRRVIESRNVEFMPKPLSIALFINGGIWVAYAILDKDIFLGIPNGVGFLLAAIQLIIIFGWPAGSHQNSNGAAHDDSQASDRPLLQA